ncbi:type II toxin-antitoxin system HigB family toxin [Pseudodesulfovibrio thermohalotolerans]|uniref:type II toxin-antitoxin system HigB family toxin n=1 Tax=Pseudodesulfovibrio thermohalotolerans TaxID=2880651 RepID=UPI0024413ABD|nr:type II toxin-antitoxin system HigB family toxin [Pseudodesulfovibrio thermohalotolerans]WFS62100.1 type II toxin-antitoxin system HigB family toxin [Pseudodesulfovibrio thermohalotolerans]
MRIISRATLREYGDSHADAKDALDSWFHEVRKEDWKTWTDIKAKYPSASPLGNDRYVFNIKGNTYRIIVVINFVAKIIYIRFVGTHAEYDKIDAEKV